MIRTATCWAAVALTCGTAAAYAEHRWGWLAAAGVLACCVAIYGSTVLGLWIWSRRVGRRVAEKGAQEVAEVFRLLVEAKLAAELREICRRLIFESAGLRDILEDPEGEKGAPGA